MGASSIGVSSSVFFGFTPERCIRRVPLRSCDERIEIPIKNDETRKAKNPSLISGLLTLEPRQQTKKKHRTASSSSASKYAVAFAAALLALLILDGLWINVVSKCVGFDYFATVENIQGRELAKRPIGLLAYLSMAAACSRASLRPGSDGGGEGGGPSAAALAAAETGFYIYSIYDFTNTFLFNGWSVPLALADTVWGTTVFAVSGAAAAAAAKAVFG